MDQVDRTVVHRTALPTCCGTTIVFSPHTISSLGADPASVEQATLSEPLQQICRRLSQQFGLTLVVVRRALNDMKCLVGTAGGLVDGDGIGCRCGFVGGVLH